MIRSLQLLLLLTLFLNTEGYYWYEVVKCIFSSSLTDVEYLWTEYFNKQLYVQFNSSVGEFVGFTEEGVSYAKKLNSGPYLQQMKAELDTYCKPGTELDHSLILEKSVKPRVELMSEQQPSGGHPAMLMCSAYDFYPPTINVYWLRDGKKVISDVTATEEMADGDWYYQIHSHLEYTPKSGEKISCVVEHISSTEHIVTDWDPSLPESDRNKIVIGSSGLVLGIILSAAGLIYYKKKSTGRILVPT